MNFDPRTDLCVLPVRALLLTAAATTCQVPTESRVSHRTRNEHRVIDCIGRPLAIFAFVVSRMAWAGKVGHNLRWSELHTVRYIMLLGFPGIGENSFAALLLANLVDSPQP